ncbi:hypothetical protein F4779DRAFT_627103 [Xylariaceae sp. FL0662B]|nr:hypothetical protein F4779DRAFT_627103 [Xylariaceae sp. FL0662B]
MIAVEILKVAFHRRKNRRAAGCRGASGRRCSGVLRRDDDPPYAQFGREKPRIRTALVVAHVYRKPEILAAVRAGVTGADYVSFAAEDCIKLIKEKGTIHRYAHDGRFAIEVGGKGCRDSNGRRRSCVEVGNHLAACKLAIEADYTVKAGLSSFEVIKAATANGPLSVGGQAPKTDHLRIGISLTESPVEDVTVLQNRETIK